MSIAECVGTKPGRGKKLRAGQGAGGKAEECQVSNSSRGNNTVRM